MESDQTFWRQMDITHISRKLQRSDLGYLPPLEEVPLTLDVLASPAGVRVVAAVLPLEPRQLP
jgi:hypothetical protein